MLPGADVVRYRHAVNKRSCGSLNDSSSSDMPTRNGRCRWLWPHFRGNLPIHARILWRILGWSWIQLISTSK